MAVGAQEVLGAVAWSCVAAAWGFAPCWASWLGRAVGKQHLSEQGGWHSLVPSPHYSTTPHGDALYTLGRAPRWDPQVRRVSKLGHIPYYSSQRRQEAPAEPWQGCAQPSDDLHLPTQQQLGKPLN